MLLKVFVVQQLQRYTRAMALAMHPATIRLSSLARLRDGRVQARLELVIAERLDLLPRKAGGARSRQCQAHYACTHACRLRYLAMRATQ
jgi:hypothetical protein